MLWSSQIADKKAILFQFPNNNKRSQALYEIFLKLLHYFGAGGLTPISKLMLLYSAAPTFSTSSSISGSVSKTDKKLYQFPTKSFHERQGYFRPLGLSPFRLLSLSKPFFPISQNSFSTRIFYSFPLVKLFSRFISSILSPPACKSSSYCSRKGGGHYVNPQILVKFSPPGLTLHIGPFWFCCIFKLQKP